MKAKTEVIDFKQEQFNIEDIDCSIKGLFVKAVLKLVELKKPFTSRDAASEYNAETENLIKINPNSAGNMLNALGFACNQIKDRKIWTWNTKLINKLKQRWG